MKRLALAGLTLIFAAFVGGAAQAVPVGTELVLAIDVSGSVDATEFAIQRDGYEDAFKDAAVISAIENSVGGIAVTVVYWSTTAIQSIAWTHLTDATSATAFANTIATTARPVSLGTLTGITNAVNLSAGLFAANGFEGDYLVIDVSADGADNVACTGGATCVPLQNARDAALAGGVTQINGMAILSLYGFTAEGSGGLEGVPYFENNLIGGVLDGQPAFAVEVAGFDDSFAQAVRDKIITEIQPVIPEPSAVTLYGVSLLLVSMATRRRRS